MISMLLPQLLVRLEQMQISTQTMSVNGDHEPEVWLIFTSAKMLSIISSPRQPLHSTRRVAYIPPSNLDRGIAQEIPVFLHSPRITQTLIYRLYMLLLYRYFHLRATPPSFVLEMGRSIALPLSSSPCNSPITRARNGSKHATCRPNPQEKSTQCIWVCPRP